MEILMSERKTVYMVMDASQDDVRRYWTGHGWTTDISLGFQSDRAKIGCWCDTSLSQSDRANRAAAFGHYTASGHYWDLYEAGCPAVLVKVEFSCTEEKTIVHRIREMAPTWNGGWTFK
jgi:hypothetical protein